MDCKPVAEAGCVGGEIGRSREPSIRKIDREVMWEVSGQSAGMRQKLWAGNSMGMTVLIRPLDLIIALMDPPAPCECPNAPIREVFNLFWNVPPDLLFCAIMALAASIIVWPGPAFLSCAEMTTNPQEAMCLRK